MYTYRADIGAANDNRHKRFRGWVWLTFLFLLMGAGLGYIQGRAYLFAGLPDLPNKQSMWALNLEPNYTLLDRQGTVIGHRGPYYGRILKLEEMPEYLPAAFLAIEDQRFYEHPGIDRKAIFRAFVENAKAGRKVQGGSTLTQQLVKNMVLTPEKTYRRKIQEMWLSYKIEQVLTKPEILELYLNRIAMGNRAFGVEAAAQRYFGKSATQLSLPEAAVLAAIPKAPSTYDPSKNPKQSHERARLVLQNMMVQGKISPQEMTVAESEPVKVVPYKETTVDEDIIGHVFDMATERAGELIGSGQNDLIIRTTLDPALQGKALSAIKKVIRANRKSKKVTEGALVSIETETGALRALIGGTSYKKSKFNRAAQAQRQPGSSFKAFVYAAALEAGYSPGTVRRDQPVDIAGWSPGNYTNRFRGPMTIRAALKLSINTVAAQIGAEVGPDKVVELAKRFGITSPLGAHYSIALGSEETTLYDMTGAYMVFANGGVRRPTYLIESIRNTGGETLYERKPTKPGRVFAQSYSRQMTSMLRDVVSGGGTGHGAKLDTREVAGKTGTTQSYRDALFVGFTADYTTGVWMGNDDNKPMYKVTGGTLPTNAWKDFMSYAHRNRKERPLGGAAPTIDDPEKQALLSFYQDLSEKFITERNLANGLQPDAILTGQN